MNNINPSKETKCLDCGTTITPDLIDDAVAVGEQQKTETVALHTCKKCRDAFLDEMAAFRWSQKAILGMGA